MGVWAERFYEDEDLAAFGLWTVNPFRVEQGHLSLRQVRWVEKKIQEIPEDKWKVIACHHPPDTLKSESIHRLLALKPDLILWGHDHQSRAFYADSAINKATVMLAAGTSISSRTRSEANSFNRVSFIDKKIKVEIFTHSAEKSEFLLTETYHFDSFGG